MNKTIKLDNNRQVCYYSNMIELYKRNEKIAKRYEKMKGKGAARILAQEYKLSERRITQIYRAYKIKKLLQHYEQK